MRDIGVARTYRTPAADRKSDREYLEGRARVRKNFHLVMNRAPSLTDLDHVDPDFDELGIPAGFLDDYTSPMMEGGHERRLRDE